MISSISSKSGKPKSRGRQGKTTTVEEFLRGSDFEEYAPSKIQEKIMGQFPQALASQVFSLVYDLNRINSVSKPIIRDAIENYRHEPRAERVVNEARRETRKGSARATHLPEVSFPSRAHVKNKGKLKHLLSK
jgi:hypothetical protein